MPAGQANFDGSGSTVDTATTLATGAKMASSTLAADIDSSQEYLTLDDPIDIPKEGGVLFIDSETVWVLSFDADYPTELGNLVRGKDGTSAASHLAGAAVVVVGKDRYHNPAHVDATIAMQESINSLLTLRGSVAPKTTDYDVVAEDGNTFFTNTGASRAVVFNLPSPSSDQSPFTFYRDEDFEIDIQALTGTTIQVGDSVSSDGGAVTLDTVGALITIRAISPTKYVATATMGNYSIA